jgi:integrase
MCIVPSCKGVEKATIKTNTARVVLLNSRALAAVTRQRAATQLVGHFIFVDPRYGTPCLDERAFRCSYGTPTLTTLGFRYRKPYNTRHS